MTRAIVYHGAPRICDCGRRMRWNQRRWVCSCGRERTRWQAMPEAERDKYRKSTQVRRLIHAETLKHWLDTIKTMLPCEDCGQHFPPCAMDFHHARGAKKFGIGQALRQQIALSTLLTELAKCDLVCANCHRIRHHGRGPCPAQS